MPKAKVEPNALPAEIRDIRGFEKFAGCVEEFCENRFHSAAEYFTVVDKDGGGGGGILSFVQMLHTNFNILYFVCVYLFSNYIYKYALSQEILYDSDVCIRK